MPKHKHGIRGEDKQEKPDSSGLTSEERREMAEAETGRQKAQSDKSGQTTA